MLHLLADAVNQLGDFFEYPLALALAGGGAIFTLGLHLLADCAPTSSPSITSDIDREACQNMDIFLEKEKSANSARAVILEGCVTVHSVLIGYDFGLQSTNAGGAMTILMIALCFHQFFEGLSVGTVFLESLIPPKVSSASAIIFAVGLPAGIVLGMVHENDSESGLITAGCANAIAAGSLMIASMTEMVGHDFFDHSLQERPILKFKMYCSLVIGFGAMAALAVWA
jgi:zinc transporter ZupT